MITAYYDPLKDVHHRLPIAPMLGKVTYLLPLVPDDAVRLLDGAIAQMGGLQGEIPAAATDNPRNAGALIHAAKELGRNDLAARLQAACDERLEPAWDRDRGEFTWGCRLNEDHPRGQYNALLALAECTSEGAWTALCTQLPPAVEPLVEGVDFPALALSEARWIGGDLRLALAPQSDAVIGRPTSFRVTGLDDAGAWAVAGPASVEVADAYLLVRTTIDRHRLVLRRA